jgi:hypothetical protein
MKKDKDMAVSKGLGEKAFKSGVKRIAGLDFELGSLKHGRDYQARCELMKNWYQGWDLANLREPIEEDTPLNLKIETHPNCFLVVGSADKVGSLGHRLVVTCVENGTDRTCILKEEQARQLLAELTELYK